VYVVGVKRKREENVENVDTHSENVDTHSEENVDTHSEPEHPLFLEKEDIF
jgi:hypothetical protein